MRICFWFWLCLIGLETFAQKDSAYSNYKPAKEKTENFWDKTYVGGDVALYGGTGTFYFNISPMIGYRPNNKGFSYGLGATYQYMSFSSAYFTDRFSWFGLRAFVRQNILERLFVHAEYENYFTKGYNYLTNKDEMITVPCANIFIGYKQNFSDFSYYYFMLGYEAIGNESAKYYMIYPLYPIVFKAGYVIDLKGK